MTPPGENLADTRALESLLARWRETRNPDDLNALFHFSRHRIAAIVRRRLNRFESLRSEAGVVTDEVSNLVAGRFWRWSEGDAFTPPATIRGYFDAMASITRRVLLDLREANDRPAANVPDPAAGVERTTPHTPPDDRIDLVLWAIDELGDAGEREAIRLHYLCELDFQEVAEVMGVGYQQAYRLVNRGLARIGAVLRRRAHPDNFDGNAAAG